ncbi:MAG TPA: VOC family protein [Stellaceae bacterium]|nr:VOC family protein [Stellaceae bacterium]
MQANPYLLFNGNCEAAFKFYEATLGAKPRLLMRYGEAPKQPGAADCEMPAGFNDKILHARIALGDTVVMASDCPPGRYEKPQGISMTLSFDKPAEAERIFHALAEGGTVQMPIAKTFFAERFGMVADRFGIPWMISCEQAAQ